MKHYPRFYGDHLTIMERIARWLKGIKKDPRFADQPAWLKAEMLDKAAAKRKMRCAKRVRS